MASYRAAVVGLGQVGLLFDDDAKRRGIWTHISAYENCDSRFALIAACDPDDARQSKAQTRIPALRCYSRLEEMMAAEKLDIVSLCTPPELHLQQIEYLSGRVRAIICEKPLGGDRSDAARAVERCATDGTLLAINYYKRFDGCVPTAAALLRNGGLGTIRSATAFYAGPLEAVGSHALDLLSFLLGPLELRHTEKTRDGRHAAVLAFGDDGIAVLQETGPREELIFELDLVGSAGRLRILDNCDRLEYSLFETSPRYSGYQELRLTAPPDFRTAERFIPLFEEVANYLDGTIATLTSDGRSALAAQSILEDIKNAV